MPEIAEQIEDVKTEELTDPFAAALLKDLTEKEEKEKQEPTEPEGEKAEGEEKTETQPEEKKDDSEKSETETEADEYLIKDDKTIQRYDALIKSGFTEEEAQDKVYKEAFDSADSQKNDKEDIMLSHLSDEEKKFLVPDEDLKNLKSAFENPPDSALLFHLNNSPELKKLFGGKIDSLDIYEDQTANAMFKLNLMESYRRTIGSYIEKIEKAKSNYNALVNAKNDFVQEIEKDFFKDYPELNNNEKQSIILSSHFVNLFKNKISLLDKEDQSDKEALKKMYNAAKEEYKKIYPALQKKFGIQKNTKVDDVLKDKKLKEMQETGSTPTNLGSENAVVIDTKNATDDDFIKALQTLKKE